MSPVERLAKPFRITGCEDRCDEFVSIVKV